MKHFFPSEYPGKYQEINHKENWKSHKYVKVTRRATEQSMGPKNRAKGKILTRLERDESITHGNSWDSTKAFQRWTCVVTSAYLEQNQSRTT